MERNTLERIASLVSLLAAVLGGWIYVESNFASAADLKRIEGTFNEQMVDLRKRNVEDKVFELEFKQKSTPKDFKAIDSALLERYKRELIDLEQRKNSTKDN